MMDLSSTIFDFIENQKKEKGKRTFETYGRKIVVFQEYLERAGVNKDNFGPFLHNAQIEDILSSVKYYVESYDIQYKSTTDSYLAALSVFFTYIRDEYGISNEFFSDNNKLKQLRSEYDNLIQILNLNQSEQAMPITEEEYKELIKVCNEKLDTPSDEEILNGNNNGVYSSYISSLVTKFVLLFGTKNKVLSEVAINDYDPILNKIVIQGYSIRLPDGLALQLKRYIKIREKILITSSVVTSQLFVDFNANAKWENSKMFFILRSVTGSTKATAASKYAIIQMLKNGVPVNLVMDFTGFSRKVCAHCQEIIDEQRGIYRQNEKNRILDSSLRQIESFDQL